MTYFRNLLAMMRKPFYGNIPLFPGSQDLSWIPDGGGSTILTDYAAEAPGGRVAVAGVTFTFTSVPKYVIYNGQWLKPNIDYTPSGTAAIMPVTVESGAEIYAVV